MRARLLIPLAVALSAITATVMAASPATSTAAPRPAVPVSAPAAPASVTKPSAAPVARPAAGGAVQRVRVQITAAQEARLASQMEGRIITLPKELGMAFRKGDLLVGFACDHQKATLAAAEAEMVKADKAMISRESLVKLQALPELELALARAEKAQAEAEVERARAQVSDCSVLAPFDGTVVRVGVNRWENVGRGAELIHIVNPAVLEVEALVPSQWLTWLGKGTAFAIHVDELGVEAQAKVTAIGGRIDAVSRTLPIRARITSNTPGLLPGMSGDAHFKVPAGG